MPEASDGRNAKANGVDDGHCDKHHEMAKSKSPLELISQGVCLPGIPRHPTYGEHRQWMLEKMALAFRVFARKGYTEGLAGHISVRDPEWPHTFWTVSRSRSSFSFILFENKEAWLSAAAELTS